MEPLQAIPMPGVGVLVEISTANSWPAGSAALTVRTAFIATNSTERLSFVSLHGGPVTSRVVGVASRPSFFMDMPFGVVIELHLAGDLNEGETVQIALAQAGATTYYPPQQIADAQ